MMKVQSPTGTLARRHADSMYKADPAYLAGKKAAIRITQQNDNPLQGKR